MGIILMLLIGCQFLNCLKKIKQDKGEINIEKLKVVSLFDGISCGQIAFERANINIDEYYAFEVDTNAIKVTQKNYPNTIQRVS